MKKKKISVTWIIAAVVILLHLLACIYIVVFVKNGVHSDEMYSYGAANSYYQPIPTYDRGVGPLYGTPEEIAEKVVNYREWISSEVVMDFLTVQKGEQFSYDSVFFNASVDYHPPLFYLILHTVMSFFPDVYSLWFGYVLSFIFLLITDIFLYKSAKLLINKYAALAVLIMYAFSSGGLMTYILIRQYSLMTAFMMMFLYFNIKIFRNKSLSRKDIIPIFIVSFLMFMTNYPIILFFGVFTALVCLYFLIKKQIKNMFAYGLTELGALILMLVILPANIMAQLNGYDPSDHPYDFITQLRFMFHYTLAFVVGIPVSFYRDAAEKIVPAVILCIILFMIPLCFLFRKEVWFKKFVSLLKRHIKRVFKKFDTKTLVLIFSVISTVAYLLVLAKTLNIDHTKVTAVRYVFPIYPIVSLLAVYLVYKLVTVFPKGRKAGIALCLALSVFTGIYTNISYPMQFLFKGEKGHMSVAELTEGKNVVLIMQTAKQREKSDWNDVVDKHDSFITTYYFNDLYKANRLFFTSGYGLKDDIDKINTEHVDYVIILMDYYELTDEENETIDPEALGEVEDFNMELVYDDPDAELEKRAELYLNDTLEQLNGGCEPEFLFVIANQDTPTGVIKLNDK